MSNLPCRVLLVEDNEDDYLIVRDLFSDVSSVQFDLRWVDNLAQARELLGSQRFDVCLLDYRLGEATGVELVREFTEAGSETPFILLTGNEDYQVDVEAAQAGAADYLLKGHINAALLERSIRYAIQRKASEAALQQAQRFAQATVDALPDNIAVLDESGTIVAVNKAWSALADAKGGTNASVGVGVNYLEFCEAGEVEEGRAVAEGIRAVLAGKQEMFCLEYPCHSPHEQRWFETRVTRFSGGGPLHVVVAHENITSRKLAEAQLRASEAGLATAQQMAHVGSWEWDLRASEGQIQNSVRWSDEAFRIFGFAPGEVEPTYDRFMRLVHPADLPRLEAMALEAARDGTCYSHDHRIILPDGTERIVHQQSEVVLEPCTGKPHKVVGTVQDITEPKRAEEALRASEERFSSAFEHAPIGIALVDPGGHWLQVNQALCDLLGFSSSELMGRTFQEITHPDDLDADLENVRRLVAGEIRFYSMEKRYLDKQGQVLWVILGVSLVRDDHGHPLYFISQIQDITERKQAETLLRQSRQRLELATESAHMGIWDWDIVAGTLAWDAQMYELYGIREQDFGGAYETWRNGLHPQDGEQADADIQAALKGTRDFHTQFRVLWPNGEVRHIEAHAIVQRAGDGSPLRMTGVNWDITERKEASQALARLAAIVESSSDAIISKSLDNTITSWNTGATMLYGYSAQEAVGRSVSTLLAPHRLDEPTRLVERVAQGERIENYETTRVHKDGRLIDVSLTVSPVKDEAGAIIGASVIARDISERKRVENALRESEARSGAVIQYALDCIITIDHESRVIEFNPAAEATFGYTRAEAMGQDLDDLIIPPAFHEAHHNGIAHYLATGEGPVLNRRVEVLARRKDGTEITVELSATAIAHSDPQLFTAYLRDITERKRSENALRESEEMFQSIVANVPGMVYQFVLQPDGSIEWPFVSEGCRDIYEIEPQVLAGSPNVTVDRIHPDDRPEFQRSVQASAQTLQPWSWEGRHRVPSGKVKWMQGVSRPQRLPEGGTLWNGVVMDITARKEAEEERDRFFTMSLDMLCIASIDGYFKRVNPAFSEILGFSEAELMARPVSDFVHPDDLASTREVVQSAAQGHAVTIFENRYRTKSGSWRWLEWKSVTVAEEGVIYAAARDMTERKEAEAGLLRLSQELEERVEERTRELEQSNTTLHLEVVERERAEQEVRAQARQHEAVAELGRRALLNLDMDTLLRGTVVLVAATLEVEMCSFWERNPNSDVLRLRAGTLQNLETPEMQAAHETAPEKRVGDSSQIGQSAFHNKPIVSEDLEHETRFEPNQVLVQQGITSKITIPVHDDVLYGVLAACSPRKQKWSQNERFFLQTVANVLSSAMARKQAEAEIVQLNTHLHGANDELRANESRLLQGNQISTDLMRLRVRTTEELEEALHQITEGAGAMLDVERSSVWLFDDEGTLLRCHDLYERGAHRHSGGFERPRGESYLPLIKAQRVVVAEDARTHPVTRAYWESYFEPHGISSILEVALVVGGKHIGVLCSEHVGTPRQWQAEDRTFASAVASVCSLVLESHERARAEAALHDAKEEAEVATKRANAANAAKSEFLSRMSHELRTPLNAILGFGQILEMRSGAADPRQRENIAQILKAGRHLLSLINEVLDIARIEAGRMSLSLEPIAAGMVVREILDLVRPLAAGRNIQLVNRVLGEEASKYLLADHQRLKQVLLNLLSNAVKYNTEGGSVFVECVVSACEPEMRAGFQHQGLLRILVRDTGVGLSEEDISKLFVPFERLGAARSQIEGTGIGLTLCKRLVEVMDGQIGVESEVGRGSTFWVELPLVASPIEQAAQAEEEEGSQNALAATATEKLTTILCIEDNLSNITLIEQALLQQNFQVKFLTAMQGSVGLELAVQHQPDLILLDVHLPDIMGDAVLRHLKGQAATRDIPVVVLSADATPSQVERLLALGARDYLTKPLDLKQFFDVVEQVCREIAR